jgi:hypothetical protein
MAGFHDVDAGTLNQFHRRLAEACMTSEEVQAVVGAAGLAETMVLALRAKRQANLIHGLFTPPEEQIAYLKRLNRELGWGFTYEDFNSLPKSPEFTDKKLVAVVLTVRLPDHEGTSGLQRTFDEVYNAAGKRQKTCWRYNGLLSDSEHLRLLGQREHKAGLSWVRINLGANNGRSTEVVRNEAGTDTRLPEAELLSCALMHPHWVRAMNGSDVQYVDIAGYEVSVPGYLPWLVVPGMNFSADNGRLWLRADDCRVKNYDWGVPVFV